MTPEEQGELLAKQVFQERLDELAKLSQYMRDSGKMEWEYIIADNWQKVIDGLDKGEVIPYECWCLPKLSANTFI
jgi:hypothetical protein